MSENPITLAVDHYIDILEKASAKSAIPPVLLFARGQFPANAEVALYASEDYAQGKLIRIKFFCTMKEVPSARCFGKLRFQDYLGLEEEIDTAVGEYRRKAFKKISRKQRHAKGNMYDQG